MIPLNLAPKVSQPPALLRRLVPCCLTSLFLLVLVPSFCLGMWERQFPSQAELAQKRLEANRQADVLQDRIQETQKSLNKALQERLSRRNRQNYTAMLQGMLNVLPEKIPEDVFLTSLSAETWHLVIEGGAQDPTALAHFLEVLKQAYTFMIFEVEEVRRAVVEQSTIENFRLSGRLRDAA